MSEPEELNFIKDQPVLEKGEEPIDYEDIQNRPDTDDILFTSATRFASGTVGDISNLAANTNSNNICTCGFQPRYIIVSGHLVESSGGGDQRACKGVAHYVGTTFAHSFLVFYNEALSAATFDVENEIYAEGTDADRSKGTITVTAITITGFTFRIKNEITAGAGGTVNATDLRWSAFK